MTRENVTRFYAHECGFPESRNISYILESDVRSRILDGRLRSVNSNHLRDLAFLLIRHAMTTETKRHGLRKNEVPEDCSSLDVGGIFNVYRPLNEGELNQLQTFINEKYPDCLHGAEHYREAEPL